MTYFDHITLSDFVICGAVLFAFILWYRWRRPINYPPGPTPLPVIGNLHNLEGTNIVDSFRKLRRQYGDIYSLSLGKFWVVVVSGTENLKELLIKRGDITSDRPDIYLMQIEPNPAVLTESGTLWKHNRSFTLSRLREFGFGKRSFESQIKEEMTFFLKTIENCNDKAFDVDRTINASMSNIVVSIVLGKRFDYGDPSFSYFIDMVEKVAHDPVFSGIVNFYPFLAKIPGDPFKALPVKRNLLEALDYFKHEIADHEKTFDANNIRDFIDAYLLEMKDDGNNSKLFSVDRLAAIILDLFMAGTETTATTIKWALLYLIQNPDIQQKMFSEIDDVVGSGRLPSINDKSKLPYCEAVMLESLRIGNIVPFSLPHKVTEDINFKNFVIPRGSIIFPNLDSVAHDDKLFPESHQFNPERFLDKDNKICGQDKILTFSLGRRVCLGESLARLELFLFLTTLVQRYKFLPPTDEGLPSNEGALGITFSPLPYKMKAVCR